MSTAYGQLFLGLMKGLVMLSTDYEQMFGHIFSAKHAAVFIGVHEMMDFEALLSSAEDALAPVESERF